MWLPMVCSAEESAYFLTSFDSVPPFLALYHPSLDCAQPTLALPMYVLRRPPRASFPLAMAKLATAGLSGAQVLYVHICCHPTGR